MPLRSGYCRSSPCLSGNSPAIVDCTHGMALVVQTGSCATWVRVIIAMRSPTLLLCLLCLLCVSTYPNPSSPSARRLNIQNRQDNVTPMAAVGGSTQNGKFAMKDDTSATQVDITAEHLTPMSASLVTFSASLQEDFGQLKKQFSNPCKDTSKNPCAERTDSTNSLLHSLATDYADTDAFRGPSSVDAGSVYYLDFRDWFRCKPCQCYFTFDRRIVASCNSSITEINAALPKETRRLTIHNSKLQVFQAGNFSQYHSLEELSVTSNKHLDTIAYTSHSTQALAIERLDLSSNSIAHIEDNSFKLFTHLQHLNLGDNNIVNITTLSFEGLHNLQHLNLSRNNITVLINGSLGHFKNLKVLDLSSNKIQILFMPGVFSNLLNLSKLLLNGSLKKATSYPNEEIARLKNLVSLSIDGVSNDTILGPEIKSLRRLVELRVGFPRRKHCHLKVITESFLENFPYLEVASFSRCNLACVDVNVYKNVPSLRSLEFISTYPYDVFKALDGLKGLQNSTLKSLSLINLIADEWPFICLYGRHAKYLSSLKLEMIDLSDNRIAFMDDEFIKRLPLTLRTLVLRGHVLTEPTLFTDILSILKHLQTLDLGANQDPASNLELSQTQADRLLQKQASYVLKVKYKDSEERNFTYKTRLLEDQQSPGSVEEFMYNTNSLHASPVCKEQVDQNGKKDVGTSNINDQNSSEHPSRQFNTTSLTASGLKYLLAPGFLKVNIRNLFRYISQLQYTELTYVDFSFCALTSVTHRTHIPPWIQATNFQGNYFSSIQQFHFHDNNSLTYLSLNNNPLGDMFASNIEFIFKKLNNLFYLDLSMNMIYQMDTNVFEGLHNLRVLIMRDNKLGLLNTNFSTFPKLEYLDLRGNSITWISKSTRHYLDIIAASHPLYIELTSNLLRCTCEGLEVLQWIWASNVHFVSKDILRCVRETGKVEDVGNIEYRVTTLQRHCVWKWLIIGLCVASVIVVCFFIVFGVMYHFRWRYLRRIALSRLVGFNPPESTSSAFKFDAFIVYSDMSRQFVVGDCLQELEVKRGHKLCVDDRDFMPGTLSVSAIVSAIQNSRKTVLILSPDFYDDEFSEYSVKMALMEEIYQKRSVLYLCVYQPLPGDEMSKSYDLLMVMKRNNYLEFPPVTETSEGIMENFWDQLSEMIGHSVANDLPGSAETTNG